MKDSFSFRYNRSKKNLGRKTLNTRSAHGVPPKHISSMHLRDQNRVDVDQLHMKEAMAALEIDVTKEVFHVLNNKKKYSRENSFLRMLIKPSRCCRSYRTQRRLATTVQRSIDIAIKDVQTSPIND